MVLCHRVERDTAHVASVAPFQTCGEPEKRHSLASCVRHNPTTQLNLNSAQFKRIRVSWVSFDYVHLFYHLWTNNTLADKRTCAPYFELYLHKWFPHSVYNQQRLAHFFSRLCSWYQSGKSTGLHNKQVLQVLYPVKGNQIKQVKRIMATLIMSTCNKNTRSQRFFIKVASGVSKGHVMIY